MGHPGFAIVGEGIKVGARNDALLEDVLTSFQVPPKISIAQGFRRKEKCIGKNIELKDLVEGSIQKIKLFH